MKDVARRPYRQTARAEAAAATRTRILDAAIDAFLTRWYDEVTLAQIAKAAGVTQQTLINHFGAKEQLLAEAVERLGPERHRRARTDDPVAGVVADYEAGGDAAVRLLALEERVPAVRPFIEVGRMGHRAWVEEAFADRIPRDGPQRRATVDALVAATDVYVWKLLRRDLKRSRAATAATMRRLADAATTTDQPPSTS